MRVQTFALSLLVAALGPTHTAHAQPVATSDTTAHAALPFELSLGRSKLDAEVVRKAVELELGRPVVLTDSPGDGASLTAIANDDHTVTVSYRTSNGTVRTRSIGIPEAAARGAEVIALLAGNLSRDEAAELLADLESKARPVNGATATKDTAPSAPPKASEAQPVPRPSVPPGEPAPSPRHARPTPASAEPPLLETPFPAINLSLFPPVTLYRTSERRIFSGELGIGYSHVGELRGFGVNVFALRTERDVRGASVATFHNFTGGTVLGVAGSALVNRRDRLRGLELSGLLNLAGGDGQGMAAAGFANWERDFEGVQAAGGINRADRFQGVQAAGVLNRAGKVTGVQAAGALNLADSLSGIQLGVVNVAGDVDGLQLGVVNVAKRVRGTSIGLVSVAGNGRVQPVLWASSALPLNAAAKFTVGPIYTQAGLGYAPGNQTYTYELGVGLHLPIGRFFVEPGAHYSEMRSAKHPFDHELIEYGHYRVAAGLDLGSVSPFAGAGVLQRFAHRADAPSSVPVSLEVFAGAAFF